MNNGNDLAMLDNSVLCILTLYSCLEKPKYFKSMCIINIILCIIFAIFFLDISFMLIILNNILVVLTPKKSQMPN